MAIKLCGGLLGDAVIAGITGLVEGGATWAIVGLLYVFWVSDGVTDGGVV